MGGRVAPHGTRTTTVLWRQTKKILSRIFSSCFVQRLDMTGKLNSRSSPSPLRMTLCRFAVPRAFFPYFLFTFSFLGDSFPSILEDIFARFVPWDLSLRSRRTGPLESNAQTRREGKEYPVQAVDFCNFFLLCFLFLEGGEGGGERIWELFLQKFFSLFDHTLVPPVLIVSWNHGLKNVSPRFFGLYVAHGLGATIKLDIQRYIHPP